MTVNSKLTQIIQVSVLFNEPKLLKRRTRAGLNKPALSFSALQRAEIAEMQGSCAPPPPLLGVSVLFNEPKLLKLMMTRTSTKLRDVSVLFNEPKLLKLYKAIKITNIGEKFQCSSTSRNC